MSVLGKTKMDKEDNSGSMPPREYVGAVENTKGKHTIYSLRCSKDILSIARRYKINPNPPVNMHWTFNQHGRIEMLHSYSPYQKNTGIFLG